MKTNFKVSSPGVWTLAFSLLTFALGAADLPSTGWSRQWLRSTNGVQAAGLLGVGRTAAALHYTVGLVLDPDTDSGEKETGTTTWTNILFETATVFEGSYSTNTGWYTVAQDGYLQYGLNVMLGDTLGDSVPTGTTISAGLNGQVAYNYKTAGVPTNVVSAQGYARAFKGDREGLQLWTSASAVIGNADAYLEVRPAGIDVYGTLNQAATNAKAACQYTYTAGAFNGTNTWGAASGTYGFTPRDGAMAVRYAPDLFSADDIQNLINQTASLQGLSNASVGTFLGRTDGSVHAGTPYQIDHSMEFVDLVYSHYKKTGSATAFVQYQGQISNALTYPVITNHIVYVRTNNPAQVGFGFEDSERLCGYNLMCSVEWYRTYAQMGEMLNALGRDGSYYTNELPNIATNIQTFLWDSTTNLFYACTISNAGVHSIPGTAYAVVVGACVGSVSNSAATQLKGMLPWNAYGLAGKGCVRYGETRNLIEGEFWSTFATGAIVKGDYQNGGYWGLYTLWLAEAVKTVSQGDADALMGSMAWQFFNEFQPTVPLEYDVDPAKLQGTARGSTASYLAAACAGRGYFKTSDTAR